MIGALTDIRDGNPETDPTALLTEPAEVIGLTPTTAGTAVRYDAACPDEINARIALNRETADRETADREERTGKPRTGRPRTGRNGPGGTDREERLWEAQQAIPPKRDS
ncbi:hypothetical protein [Actinoplanes sp. G11-F43]|uniref:hypothetical protein n=1 Tax=Actinoplanes sp. G11-F43 TaxID=3424130 RepID=UPI003D344742